MKIHIIRHGQTMANHKQLYCGQTDLPLWENGIKQIKDFTEQDIYPQNINLLFTSDLLRTKETAQLIYGSAHLEAIPELAEFDFGIFEMKSHEDLKGCTDYQRWITDDSGLISCPNGENKQQFIKRVLAGYTLLLEKSMVAESTLLVSHGGVIATIMDYLFPNQLNFYEWQPKLGRGYTLEFTSDRLCEYKRI